MKALIVWLITGVLFGVGLCISGMIHPRTVQAFLDVAGAWDPTLLFVLGGAVVTTFFGYRLILARNVPLYANQFHLAVNRSIDTRLIVGAAIFGIGWGLLGYCPGPAIVNLASLHEEPLLFVIAMLVGNRLGEWVERH
jgi:uncharacterized membrane protein YedE/YeeE